MDLLLRLLGAVLEVEPWNLARHTKVGKGVGGVRTAVPGYLKECARTEPCLLVQQQVARLGDQLVDPTAKTPWKSDPEVIKRRVEEVVAMLAASRRYRPRFGLQQAAVESQKSTLVTAETAHASPEQPATVQQRQQQGAVEPKESSILRLALRSYVITAGRVSYCNDLLTMRVECPFFLPSEEFGSWGALRAGGTS